MTRTTESVAPRGPIGRVKTSLVADSSAAVQRCAERPPEVCRDRSVSWAIRYARIDPLVVAVAPAGARRRRRRCRGRRCSVRQVGPARRRRRRQGDCRSRQPGGGVLDGVGPLRPAGASLRPRPSLAAGDSPRRHPGDSDSQQHDQGAPRQPAPDARPPPRHRGCPRPRLPERARDGRDPPLWRPGRPRLALCPDWRPAPGDDVGLPGDDPGGRVRPDPDRRQLADRRARRRPAGRRDPAVLLLALRPDRRDVLTTGPSRQRGT